MALSTDFKDDVLASSNSKRKYNMIHNPDGTVSFEDVTVYSQEGSDFGAKEVNEEREEINKHTTLLGDTDISSIEDGTVTGAIAGLNGKIKHQFVQGGLIATSNVNNYFRSAHVTFETPYKTGTKPNVVATARNYGNTAIDARLTTLYKNESATGVDLFVADPQGEIGGLGYEISWMAVGEID